MSVALALALAAALGGLTPIFTEPSWWFVCFGTIGVVSFTVAAIRALARGWWWAPLGGVVVLVISLTFSFAPGAAIIGFIPTLGVFDACVALVAEGADSIGSQSIPADPVTGIVFMLTAGAGVLVLVLDAIALQFRRPALTGAVLLGLLAVPTFFDPAQADPFYFFVTAAGYLFILYLGMGEARSVGAIGVGAIAVATALIVPILLPAVAPESPEDAPGLGGFTVGINTFVSLGENLRRPNDTRVLTYTTDSESGQYLTVSSIDNFEGERWEPTVPEGNDGTLDSIGPIPGLGTGIDTFTGVTSITVTNMGGRWAPVPYAPTSILGLDNTWSWDPENLTVTSVDSSIRNESYDVTTVEALPTQQQLRAAGDAVPAGFEKYLAMPSDLPDIVAQTAASVAGGGATNFDQALALQSYFTGGGFEYSERAPVLEGYDGTSAGVIGRFLEEKSGYCVHFSSAMAVMARSLGIPARISVGFTPGDLIAPNDDEEPYFAVSTSNLHAWPELYFNNVGWVRFEPTVGRGALPDFPDRVDTTPTDPSEPTSTPTAAPSAAAPTSTPTPTGGPVDVGDSTSVTATLAAITVTVLGLAAVVILLLPLLPVLRRSSRRARRYWRIWRRHSAADAWREVSDTAIDLGWKAGATTPREFEDLVRAGMGAPAQEALERLRNAIEATAYSPTPAPARVSDVRVVRRGMARASARADRWRARFAPASAALRRRART